MNIQHLEFVVKIKAFGSINKAASYLFLSQSHLSNILRNLEQELGYPLFYRTHNGVSVTEAGKIFFEHAERFLDSYSDFSAFCVGGNANQETIHMHIGASIYSHAEDALSLMLTQMPNMNLDIVIEEILSLDVPQKVVSGEIDLGIISYNTVYDESINKTILQNNLVFKQLARKTPQIILSKNHPYLDKVLASPASVQDFHLPFMCYYGFENDIKHFNDTYAFTDIHVPDHNIITATSAAFLDRIMAQSNAYTISPSHEVYPDVIETMNLTAIPFKGMENSIAVGYLYSKSRPLPKYIKTYIDCLKQFYAISEETANM